MIVGRFRFENHAAIPTGVIRMGGDDRFRYRIPRSPAMILFRMMGGRAQSYLAERLTKEGWYDTDTVWKPDEFRELKRIALDLGFGHVESGPLVRSSYHAHEQAESYDTGKVRS
jgi:hypothetical protein